jgi:hypothetical protein
VRVTHTPPELPVRRDLHVQPNVASAHTLPRRTVEADGCPEQSLLAQAPGLAVWPATRGRAQPELEHEIDGQVVTNSALEGKKAVVRMQKSSICNTLREQAKIAQCQSWLAPLKILETKAPHPSSNWTVGSAEAPSYSFANQHNCDIAGV